MLAFTQLVLVAASLSSVLVSAAPFTKRASLTGSSTTGDVTVHTDYATYTGDTISGACGYAASTMNTLSHVLALEGAFGGPLDKASMCSVCMEIVSSLAGGPTKTAYATLIDQRNYGKDGIDLSPAVFGELFDGATTGRFCASGCDGGAWQVSWKPAADASKCVSKWNGHCTTGNTGNFC